MPEDDLAYPADRDFAAAVIALRVKYKRTLALAAEQDRKHVIADFAREMMELHLAQGFESLGSKEFQLRASNGAIFAQHEIMTVTREPEAHLVRELIDCELLLWRAKAMVTQPEDHGRSTQARIDGFMSRVAEAVRKISKKDIWLVGGYTDATEFERFQRDDPRTTQSARRAFDRVLNLNPADFVRDLDKLSGKK